MTASILMALFGGALIGVAASLLLLTIGRVSGISGILGGLIHPPDEDTPWRLVFVFGLLVGGVLLAQLAPETLRVPTGRSLGTMALAGGLVGVGTRLGGGFTSGHGVCGLSRLSMRSLLATGTFMAAGICTATLFTLLTGS